MPEKAIIDTSTLIALDKIALSDILCKIYTEIILPEAVISEFGTPPFDCYSTKNVKSQLVKLFVSELNL
jgi:predicted nucleic acid-binding protein